MAQPACPPKRRKAPRNELCDVLVAGVDGRHDVAPVHFGLQHDGVHTVLVGALRHLAAAMLLVGKPDTLGQAAATVGAVLASQDAVVGPFQAGVGVGVALVLESDGVLGHVAVDVGTLLADDALPVDLAHHAALPARKAHHLEPHRVGHVALDQEAAAGFSLLRSAIRRSR